MTESRFVIIGVGAVGGSIAGLVADSGFPVAMVARGEHRRAIEEHGLQLALFDKNIIALSDCFRSISDVNWQVGDIVVLATKLNDAESVLDDLLSVAGPKIPVVCATNGLAAERWAKTRFENVISMLVWVMATHLHAGQVILHSEIPRGVLDVGTIQGDPKFAQQVAEILGAAEFESKVRDDILAWKRAKWITNLGGAAQAMVEDDWMSVLKAAQAEGEKVLQASGLSRVPTDELLLRCTSTRMTEVEGFQRRGGSTWQSQKRGKPLESVYIEGAMAELGESLGVPVPVNRFLANVSKAPRKLSRDEVLCQ